MRYSPEALVAFVETVATGSFSAAARRLHKSQSTISTAVANLEADLGVTLFDRSSRHPVLTPQGKQVLSHVQAILSASERLDQLAIHFAGQTETRLTLVLSDTLHPSALETLLHQFDQRYPHTEFECLIGEDDDVIDLLQKERAQLGLIEARESYPTEIGAMRIPTQTRMGIFVAPTHPLAAQERVTNEQLHDWRELRLSTYFGRDRAPANGPVWSAANYLLLFSMAAYGLGWSVLPCGLVEEFSPSGPLTMLEVPGWPKVISTDLVWNKRNPPGPAGNWIRQHLQQWPRFD